MMQADHLPSRPGMLRTWVLAARVPTLPAAVVPVLVGTATAWSAGYFRLGPFVAALAASLLIQVGTNLANDYFDFRKGADTSARLGPVRVTQAGLVAPGTVLRATLLTFGLAALVGAYLVYEGGWPILAIGLLSILSGMAYTGGPYPLGYHGLGDVFVMVFFGFVAVCGTAFVQLGHVPALAAWAAVPVGALATAILVVNNLRDRPTDARVGKRTLAVRLGRTGVLVEYVLLLAAAYAIPLALALGGRAWAALPLATAPLAVARVRALAAAVSGPDFNRCLAATGQLMMLHGLVFAIGLWLG